MSYDILFVVLPISTLHDNVALVNVKCMIADKQRKKENSFIPMNYPCKHSKQLKGTRSSAVADKHVIYTVFHKIGTHWFLSITLPNVAHFL